MTGSGWDAESWAPGDPGAYGTLSRSFSQTSTDASSILADLRAIGEQAGDESIWMGDAANVFRQEFGKLPSQLEKLAASYDTASQALSEYGATLSSLKTRATRACRDGLAAEGDVSVATAGRDSAVDAAARATSEARATNPDAPAVSASTGGYDSAIAAARSRINSARAELADVDSDRKSAEQRAADRLHDAHEQGIKNESWWKRALRTTLKVIAVICVIIAIVILIVVVVVFISFAWSALLMGATFLQALSLGAAAVGGLSVLGVGLGTIATVAGVAELAANVGRKLLGDDSVTWKGVALQSALTFGPAALFKGISSLRGLGTVAGGADGASPGLSTLTGSADNAVRAGDDVAPVAGDAATGAGSVVSTGTSTVVQGTAGRNVVEWTVDEDGFTTKATMVLKELFTGAKRSSAEARAQGAAGAAGADTDVGGHIVGHRFTLDQGGVNVFPQDGSFNNSAYKVLENEWADWIKNGKEVRATVELVRPPGSARPTEIRIDYEVIDPATGNVVYDNVEVFGNTANDTFVRVKSADMANY